MNTNSRNLSLCQTCEGRGVYVYTPSTEEWRDGTLGYRTLCVGCNGSGRVWEELYVFRTPYEQEPV